MKPKAIFCVDILHQFNRVYCEKNISDIEEMFDIERKVYTKAQLLENPEISKEAEYVFSTWSFAPFTEEEIAKVFPSLKCVFYGAGTVQGFARPFLSKGIKVFSAWGANAVPVAEYTLAQILLANKGYFGNLLQIKKDGFVKASEYVNSTMPGNFSVDVGIIGAGMIGKLVINLLKPFNIGVKVFDPFLPDAKAEELGVTKTSLEDIFSTCQTVSNHLANNEQTKGILDYSLFSLMKENAVFINTGRGAQVVEADLVRAMREVPTRFALLDVTEPEPFLPDSDIANTENILITTHIAGSLGRETWRLGEYMIEEARRFLAGEGTRYEVTKEMLECMA